MEQRFAEYFPAARHFIVKQTKITTTYSPC